MENNCFGSKEYSSKSGICKNCKRYATCGLVQKKKPTNKTGIH